MNTSDCGYSVYWGLGVMGKGLVTYSVFLLSCFSQCIGLSGRFWWHVKFPPGSWGLIQIKACQIWCSYGSYCCKVDSEEMHGPDSPWQQTAHYKNPGNHFFFASVNEIFWSFSQPEMRSAYCCMGAHSTCCGAAGWLLTACWEAQFSRWMLHEYLLNWTHVHNILGMSLLHWGLSWNSTWPSISQKRQNMVENQGQLREKQGCPHAPGSSKWWLLQTPCVIMVVSHGESCRGGGVHIWTENGEVNGAMCLVAYSSSCLQHSGEHVDLFEYIFLSLDWRVLLIMAWDQRLMQQLLLAMWSWNTYRCLNREYRCWQKISLPFHFWFCLSSTTSKAHSNWSLSAEKCMCHKAEFPPREAGHFWI